MQNTSEVELKLKFRFEGEYPEERVQELMEKVTNALYHEYSSGNGFSPDDLDDVCTDGCTVKFGEICIVDNYYDPHVKGRYTHTIDFRKADE